jgi:hypothetical protein
VPVNCLDGETRFGLECSDVGLVCGALSVHPNWAGCLGAGAPCSPTAFDPLGFDFEGGVGCDGPRLAACVNGGIALLECTRQLRGAACQRLSALHRDPGLIGPGPSSSACTVANECDPRDHGTRCEGDSVVFCAAGHVARVRCLELGLGSCSAPYSPASGRCSPRP